MAARFDVEVEGLAILDGLPENMVPVVNGAFRRMMQDVRDRARKNVTAGRPGLIGRTGALQRSIRLGPYRQWSVGAMGEQRVYSNAPYARVHEPPDGRDQTIIRARTRPFLVFRLWNPADTSAPTGSWVSVRQVIVPARPFLRPAVEAAVRLWPEYVAESLEFIWRQIRS